MSSVIREAESCIPNSRLNLPHLSGIVDSDVVTTDEQVEQQQGRFGERRARGASGSNLMVSPVQQLWLGTPPGCTASKFAIFAALLTCRLWDMYPDTQQGHTSSLGPMLGLGMSPMLPVQPHPEGAPCSQASSKLAESQRAELGWMKSIHFQHFALI